MLWGPISKEDGQCLHSATRNVRIIDLWVDLGRQFMSAVYHSIGRVVIAFYQSQGAYNPQLWPQGGILSVRRFFRLAGKPSPLNMGTRKLLALLARL